MVNAVTVSPHDHADPIARAAPEGSPIVSREREEVLDGAPEIGGVKISEGDSMSTIVSAANRDPAAYPNPDRFDITRDRPHLAFGTGTHVCAGSHMARLEMRVTLEMLFERFPRIGLAGPVDRLRSNFINGIKRMPVALNAARTH